MAQSLYFEDFAVGSKFDTYSRTVTEADHSLFCALVGYHVPLFIDEEFAKQTQYGGRICPSALVMSFSTAMTESLFRTNVLALLAVENGRFHAPVRPGDTIRTQVEVIQAKVRPSWFVLLRSKYPPERRAIRPVITVSASADEK